MRKAADSGRKTRRQEAGWHEVRSIRTTTSPPTKRSRPVVWTARAAWIVLPFTIGTAIEEAIQPWSHSPQILAAALMWAAWFAGLVALLAPRPWGFTLLR